MRTVEEIRARLEVAREADFFGVALNDLAMYLPEHIPQNLTLEPPPTMEQAKQLIAEYLPFAFEKAEDHRSLSAMRSVLHIINWAWLGEMPNLLAFAESEDNYTNYGVPILKRAALEVGVPLPTFIEFWIDGEPCTHSCDQGCG